MRLHVFVAPLMLLLWLAGHNAMRDATNPTMTTCSWSPSGTVYVWPGYVQPFVTDLPCPGYNIDISPADSTAGFSSGAGCTLTSVTTGGSGTFKVRGCVDGTVTVTVRDGSTVVQQITVVVSWLNEQPAAVEHA